MASSNFSAFRCRLRSDHPLDSDRIEKVAEYVKENIQDFDLGQHSRACL
jgi:hypothetical protein